MGTPRPTQRSWRAPALALTQLRLCMPGTEISLGMFFQPADRMPNNGKKKKKHTALPTSPASCKGKPRTGPAASGVGREGDGKASQDQASLQLGHWAQHPVSPRAARSAPRLAPLTSGKGKDPSARQIHVAPRPGSCLAHLARPTAGMLQQPETALMSEACGGARCQPRKLLIAKPPPARPFARGSHPNRLLQPLLVSFQPW